ncbi:MAG: hypothetical protein V7744_03640 [Pseudomonadales bacterium]
MDEPQEKLGYCHPDYAASLSEYGSPRYLEHSKGWILQRPIPGYNDFSDAMGLYPLFSCQQWSLIPRDIDQLEDSGLVSLVVVTDPLLVECDRGVFSRFDFSRIFKTHYLADTRQAPEQIISKHHAYYARKAAREITVEVSEFSAQFLEDWLDLYSQLIVRYEITDLRAFSRESFLKLLNMPGVYLFRALRKGRLVGAQIMVVQKNVAFAHLAAFTDEGYEYGASYILDRSALEYFRCKANYINWGGGSTNDPNDGLSKYKSGWSTVQKDAYLLGITFNFARYEQLSGEMKEQGATDYFPAYRNREFQKL